MKRMLDAKAYHWAVWESRQRIVAAGLCTDREAQDLDIETLLSLADSVVEQEQS